MQKLLLATTNSGKLREIRDILGGVPFELMTLAAWPGLRPPEETGRTFEDNARQKALYYAASTGTLTGPFEYAAGGRAETFCAGAFNSSRIFLPARAPKTSPSSRELLARRLAP